MKFFRLIRMLLWIKLGKGRKLVILQELHRNGTIKESLIPMWGLPLDAYYSPNRTPYSLFWGVKNPHVYLINHSQRGK